MTTPTTWSEFTAELDDAIQAHMEWSRRVLRCAVLRTTPDDDVLGNDAHELCRLGRWFSKNRAFFESLDFQKTDALAINHRKMHDAIRDICKKILANKPGDEASLQAFETSQTLLIEYLSHFKTLCTQIDSQIDPLTGLALRHHLEHKFELLKNRCKRTDSCAAIILIDIDHFKSVNDQYGHMGGDLVLKEVAKCLTSNIRDSDEAYRYGGDELLVLLELNSPDEAILTAERLLHAIREQAITSSEGAIIRLSATMGLAKAQSTDTLSDILQRADTALYQGKERGRNCYVLAGDADEIQRSQN